MAPDGLFCEDAEEGARFGLLCLMTGISEEAWCASWLVDLEFILWRAATGDPVEGQMNVVSRRQAELLRLLSEEAGGWWAYEDSRGPTFLSTEDWLSRFQGRFPTV
jgi:hypothetical protein